MNNNLPKPGQILRRTQWNVDMFGRGYEGQEMGVVLYCSHISDDTVLCTFMPEGKTSLDDSDMFIASRAGVLNKSLTWSFEDEQT